MIYLKKPYCHTQKASSHFGLEGEFPVCPESILGIQPKMGQIMMSEQIKEEIMNIQGTLRMWVASGSCAPNLKTSSVWYVILK